MILLKNKIKYFDFFSVFCVLNLFFATLLISEELISEEPISEEPFIVNKSKVEILTLNNLVEGLLKNFPVILAETQEIDSAEARKRSALGEFDTKLKNKTLVRPFGYYETQQSDSVVEQPLEELGVDLYAGYRIGDGNFADYEGKDVTTDGGEFRAGINLPVLQDSQIDSRRAGIARADLDIDVASQLLLNKQIFSILKASYAYWSWVATGKQMDITKELYETAKRRDIGIKERVKAGQLPEFESKDNLRNVLGREIKLIQARRDFQEASIKLSLFYRDAAGSTRLPDYAMLPKNIPPANWGDELDQSKLYKRALANRPEVKNINLSLEKLNIELNLAKNNYKPILDLQAEISQDSGSNDDTREPSELRVGLFFELPFQRRKARGKIEELDAKIIQITNKKQFLEDTIMAEVRDALSELENTEIQIRIASQELKLAKELEEGERVRFRNGESTILIVNLREQATADSAVRKVKALANYHKAEAKLLATLGENLLIKNSNT